MGSLYAAPTVRGRSRQRIENATALLSKNHASTTRRSRTGPNGRAPKESASSVNLTYFASSCRNTQDILTDLPEDLTPLNDARMSHHYDSLSLSHALSTPFSVPPGITRSR
jgi:hypothetical protein